MARDVSVGQTVAASLQTPTLFSIAQDLGKMEVDINVAEPDIGNVKPGDTVDFSVLAYPNRTFHGTVAQVRINPQTVNNVVTYDVVVLVDNRDGALLPGMTANATIDVATAKNALVVPLSALQWSPHANASTGTASSAAGSQSPWGSVQARRPTRPAPLPPARPARSSSTATAQPTRVPVRCDADDDDSSRRHAVRSRRDLSTGDPVVVASKGSAQHVDARRRRRRGRDRQPDARQHRYAGIH